MKCIAVDDEPLSLKQIASYISQVPYLELVATCSNPFEAIEVLGKESVDLMFIDINMPDLNGLDFVKTLIVKPLIIFTTAYSEYAVDGFKVDAVDYLLKPFSVQDLIKASEKARLRYEFLKQRNSEVDIETPKIKSDGSLFLKCDYRIVRINVDDIKYIESMGEYVRFFVEGNQHPITSLVSMKKIEEILPASHFLRIHRSYIVNMQKITEISRLRVIFDKDTYIPVGDNYKEKFTAYINGRSLNK
ncbi:MAG: LytTR family DNA-binding domain-containing protein [Muribaculaceae bacterium]|jgi:DNA-binding LytR/AlgR family response regulator|nr:LytTR family DNA-binding domain-containing protein [Muribaculaceae bacterium]